MSFGTQVKEELCRGEPARKCCARAEAYGVLLFCHTFAPREIKVVTGSAAFAGRLPELFRRAFRLSFDQRPEPGEAGKRIFLIHDPDKLSAIREIYGIDPAVSLAHHINFAVLDGLPAGGLPDCRLRKRPGEGIPSGAGDLSL